MGFRVLKKLTRYSTIVGFAIRELRETLAVSQADLARAADMAQASWSKVEKGDTVANIQHLSRVGGKLGVPASSILLRADEVRIKLIGHGWQVIDRKLNDSEVDLLLDGLMFNLKIMELKAFDSKSQPVTVGGIQSSVYSKFASLYSYVTDFILDSADSAVSAVVDTVFENPTKSTAIVAGTVVTGGAALAVAAPVIGAVASAAGLGVAVGSLSGAAASSAGLAVGSGSLAAGGLGMAGGTAVVAGVGAATGAAVTTAVTGISDRSTLSQSTIGLKVLGINPDSLNKESREWLESLKSENSNKSSAKSTNGQIFDMAISGSEQMIKMQS